MGLFDTNKKKLYMIVVEDIDNKTGLDEAIEILEDNGIYVYTHIVSGTKSGYIYGDKEEIMDARAALEDTRYWISDEPMDMVMTKLVLNGRSL